MAKTFREYLKDDCYNLIADVIIGRIKSHGKIDYRDFVSSHKGTFIEYDTHEVKFYYIKDKPETKFELTVVVETSLNFKWYKRYDDDEDSIKTAWYSIRFIGDLASKQPLRVLDINIYDKELRPKEGLDEEFIPYISTEQYDAVAERILAKYYPEALIKPTLIDVEQLAKNMGLRVQRGQINSERMIYGQIYFADYNGIKAGTVVVDNGLHFLCNIGSDRLTVAHECCHWQLHRKTFLLQRLLNPGITNIQCGVTGTPDDKLGVNVRLMEIQANAISCRILMPKEMFYKKAEECISLMRKGQPGVTRLDVMPQVIDMLAAFFGVSKAAAKIRLVDVGIAEAVGCNIWLDNHYVEPYIVPLDYVAKRKTFTVRPEDVAAESLVRPKLGELAQAGKVLYVDGHLVWNNQKYWHRTPDGLRLTKYARENIVESCLPFDVIVSNDKVATFNYCWLNRDKDSGYNEQCEFNEFDLTDEQNYEIERAEEIQTLYSRLGNDQETNLEVILQFLGSDRKTITDMAGIDKKSLWNWTRGGKKASKEEFVRFCLTLHLPFIITSYLFEKQGIPLQVKRDYLYIHVLTHRFCEDLDCNLAFLRKKGIKI